MKGGCGRRDTRVKFLLFLFVKGEKVEEWPEKK